MKYDCTKKWFDRVIHTLSDYLWMWLALNFEDGAYNMRRSTNTFSWWILLVGMDKQYSFVYKSVVLELLFSYLLSDYFHAELYLEFGTKLSKIP